MQSISINPCSFAPAKWVKEYFATANLRRSIRDFIALSLHEIDKHPRECLVIGLWVTHIGKHLRKGFLAILGNILLVHIK